MEKYTMFMDWENQYSENEYTTQSNLQIQCNPYQAINGILHRASSSSSKLLQACPTLCDPIVGSPPGSTVPGILQARTLEWVAIAFPIV